MKSYLMYDLTHYLLAIISHHGNVKVVLSKNVLGRRINELIITLLYVCPLVLEEIWQDTG